MMIIATNDKKSFDIMNIICTYDEPSFDVPPATIVTDPEVIAPCPHLA